MATRQTARRLKALELKIQAAMDAVAQQQADDHVFDFFPNTRWLEERSIRVDPRGPYERRGRVLKWQEWMDTWPHIAALIDALEDLQHEVYHFPYPGEPPELPASDLLVERLRTLQTRYIEMLARCPDPIERQKWLSNSTAPLLCVTRCL